MAVVEYLHPDGNANIGFGSPMTRHPQIGPELGPWGEPLDASLAPGAAGFAGPSACGPRPADSWTCGLASIDPYLGRFISRESLARHAARPATLQPLTPTRSMTPVALLDPSSVLLDGQKPTKQSVGG